MQCLNLFATACLVDLPQYCRVVYLFFWARLCTCDSCIVSFEDKFVCSVNSNLMYFRGLNSLNTQSFLKEIPKSAKCFTSFVVE